MFSTQSPVRLMTQPGVIEADIGLQQHYQTELHTVNHDLTITLGLSGKAMPIIHIVSLTFGVTC